MFLGRVIGQVWATRKSEDLVGKRLLVIEPLDERREPAAPKVSAVVAADPVGADIGEHVLVAFGKAARVACGGDGDYAFEAAGIAALVSTCLDATRRRGTTVVVGVDVSMATTEFLPVLLATQGKRIVGTLLGDCHPQRDIPMLLAAWRAGRLDLESMISHRLDLSEVNEGLDRLRRADGIRTVLEVGGS